MLRVTLVSLAMGLSLTPALGNQSIRYCYNCTLNNQARVSVPQRYQARARPINVYPAVPIASVAPGYAAPVDPYYTGYGNVYLPQGSRCWMQPDPYTFLGEIFGYDYIYVCQ